LENKTVIPFNGLARQYKNLKEEILEATDLVYGSGRMLDGPYTYEFEKAMSLRTDRRYAVAVNSCSMALLICYVFFAATQGKKNVAIPSYSFVATSNAPDLAGWQRHFIDVDGNGLMDIDELDAHKLDISLLSYVNLYGNVLDYDKLKVVTSFFHNIPILEDAAQSFGASYKGVPSGKLGDASCLSFDPTKNLPNYGSGGMVLTDNQALFMFAMNFRDNGKMSGLRENGSNTKMSETDCAQMLIKLRYFDQWQERRAKIAQFYTDCLDGVFAECPKSNPDVVHAWHKYVILLADRDALKDYLDEKGIETKTFSYILQNTAVYPGASHLNQCSLGLPIYPEMSDAEVETVVGHIQKFFKSYTNP
jgi:dTDP-4-amino-4,6-dideoxygalactose transaminase